MNLFLDNVVHIQKNGIFKMAQLWKNIKIILNIIVLKNFGYFSKNLNEVLKIFQEYS